MYASDIASDLDPGSSPSSPSIAIEASESESEAVVVTDQVSIESTSTSTPTQPEEVESGSSDTPRPGTSTENPAPSAAVVGRPRFLTLKWLKRGSGSKPKPMPVLNKNRRLLLDYKAIKENPLDHVYIEPLPSNILEWHYVLRGPAGTPYEGGLYHGKLEFPQDFPFRPPGIYMITPNGRFRPNFRLCLSISDYHPDTRDPTWSCGTIIEGILSFMVEKTNTLGAVKSTVDEKRYYALASYEFNVQDKVFCELFPELVEEINLELPNRAEEVARLRKQFEQDNQSPLESFFGKYRAFMRRTFQRKEKDKDRN